jgi:hypothetical protein
MITSENIRSITHTTANFHGMEEIQIEYRQTLWRRLLGRPALRLTYVLFRPSYAGQPYWRDSRGQPVSASDAIRLDSIRNSMQGGSWTA